MSNPTIDEIAAGLKVALEAGLQAGNSRVQELKHDAKKNSGQPVIEECGNAIAMVKLDGRSHLARAIKNCSNIGISISSMDSTKFRGYYAIHASPEIQGDPAVQMQNSSIRERTAEAIAESLKKHLGLQTTVLYWRS